MKFHSFALAALCTAIVVEASNPHEARLNARHNRLSRRTSNNKLAKRCKNRPQGPSSSSSAPATQPTQDNSNNNNNNSGDNSGSNNSGNNGNNDQNNNNNNGGQQNNGGDQNNNSGNNNNNNNSSNNSGNSGNNSGSSNGSSGGSIGGLLNVASNCGDIGATHDITSITGPNGNLYWLNCGLEDSSGWRPPFIKMSDIQFVDLNDALKDSNSPFHACQAFTDLFYKHGNENGIPPIVLASFAMQESSCNPQTTGGGGEAGLMQLTHEKCVGTSDCYEPDFNIGTGARFFKTLLDNNGGDVLTSVGNYNGWYKGMTKDAATAARNSACCRCQQNLDYIFQTVNGWWQNVNAYSNHLGAYFNLDVC
ncbi:hypothetical protein VNI00_004102 [Paramarasmius palmivorus]|uniref:Transglycosylase SLT domain-containing protein n=1 Tax=Paramarasmius palmivorus TaxID=297713 RepID=A0AAW0DQU2_9AGAR